MPGRALRRALLGWYARRRRALPWRGARDPYRVWVSEVMLQQTRIATAVPYYRAFLVRFPTLRTLARAREADVLAAWSGLGYYRRARSLHAAAREVVREHAARVPDDPAAFARLPGVGRYTAGAVLSIAYGRALPALDGNAARVLSRLEALPASVRDAAGARRLWERAAALVPAERPGDWNQALMELGATVCLPRAPRCAGCPVRRHCRALALGRVDRLPPVPARRAEERVRMAYVLVARRGRVLMARRAGPLLTGLWEPPGVELRGTPAAAALRRRLAGLGLRARLAPTGVVIRHTITHRAIVAEVWRGEPAGPAPGTAHRAGAPARPRWVDPRAPGVGLTALGRKLARLAVAPRPRARKLARPAVDP